MEDAETSAMSRSSRNETVDAEEGEIDSDLEEGEIIESDGDEEVPTKSPPRAESPNRGIESFSQPKSEKANSRYSKSHLIQTNRKKGYDVWADYYKDRYGKLNSSPDSKDSDSNDSWVEKPLERRRPNVEKPSKTRASSRKDRARERKRDRATSAAANAAIPVAQLPQQLQQQRPPCRYWSMGQCKKGDSCDFRHAGERTKKRDVCKFYSSGVCSRGNDCLFMHGDFPCKFFHTQSTCHSGDNCRFSHDKLTPETEELLKKFLATKSEEIKQETPAQAAPPALPTIYNSTKNQSENSSNIDPTLGTPHPSVLGQLNIEKGKKVLLPYPANDVPVRFQSPLAGSRLPGDEKGADIKEEEEKQDEEEPQSEYGYQQDQDQPWELGDHPNDWISEPIAEPPPPPPPPLPPPPQPLPPASIPSQPVIPERIPYDIEPPPAKQARIEDEFRVYGEREAEFAPLRPPPPPNFHPEEVNTNFISHLQFQPPPPHSFDLPPPPPRPPARDEFFDRPPPGFGIPDDGPMFLRQEPNSLRGLPSQLQRPGFNPPPFPRFPHPRLHDIDPRLHRRFSPPPHPDMFHREHLVPPDSGPLPPPPPQPPPPPPPPHFDEYAADRFPLPPSRAPRAPFHESSGVTRSRKSRWSPPEYPDRIVLPPNDSPEMRFDSRRVPLDDSLHSQREIEPLPPPSLPPVQVVQNLRDEPPFPPEERRLAPSFQGSFERVGERKEDFKPVTQSTVEVSRDPRLRGKKSAAVDEDSGETLEPSVLGIKMEMPPSLKKEEVKTNGPSLADMFKNIDPTASPFG